MVRDTTQISDEKDRTQRAIVKGSCQTSVNFRARENKTTVFAQRYQPISNLMTRWGSRCSKSRGEGQEGATWSYKQTRGKESMKRSTRKKERENEPEKESSLEPRERFEKRRRNITILPC